MRRRLRVRQRECVFFISSFSDWELFVMHILLSAVFLLVFMEVGMWQVHREVGEFDVMRGRRGGSWI